MNSTFSCVNWVSFFSTWPGASPGLRVWGGQHPEPLNGSAGGAPSGVQGPWSLIQHLGCSLVCYTSKHLTALCTTDTKLDQQVKTITLYSTAPMLGTLSPSIRVGVARAPAVPRFPRLCVLVMPFHYELKHLAQHWTAHSHSVHWPVVCTTPRHAYMSTCCKLTCVDKQGIRDLANVYCN